MKKIGIVIAVPRELKAFLESESKIEEIQIKYYTIYKTIINNNEIYAIKGGSGMVDASSATSLLIYYFNCEIILNYGVTGCLTRGIKAKELYIVEKACNSGFDTSAVDPVKPCEYLDLGGMYIPLDNELSKLALSLDNSASLTICASSDKFIASKEDKERIFNMTKASICDMECAAIARVCYLNKVKLLSIKCISDEFDGDGSQFQENIIESGKKAFDLLRKVLMSI